MRGYTPALGPDGGQVLITVDGKTSDKPVPRFDSYSTYHRIATLPIAEGLDGTKVHTVTIEVHPDQPDRHSIAFLPRVREWPGGGLPSRR